MTPTLTHDTPALHPGQTGPQVRYILQAEAAVVLALSLWAYGTLGHSWVLFAVLILVPDAAMLGYLRDPRTGALVYNLAHTYVPAVALLAVGYWLAAPLCIAFGLIWIAHIAADRLMGFGLKYARGFNATHLTAKA